MDLSGHDLSGLDLDTSEGSFPPSLVEIALELAASSLPVFPCSMDRRPCILGGGGFHGASTDPATIRDLFAHAGARLIGIPTGLQTGFDALDIDYKNGAQGWETENRARLPETRIHQTQSGGRHYLYRHHERVRNSAGRIAPGVDVRGDGGYIIHPPSPGYSVISESEIADWPAWLLDVILRPEPVAQRPACSEPGEPISSSRLAGFIGKQLDGVRGAADGQKHERLRNAARAIGGVAEQAGLSDEGAIARLMEALPATVQDWNGARRTAAWGLAEGRKQRISLKDRPNPRALGSKDRRVKPDTKQVTASSEPHPPWFEARQTDKQGEPRGNLANAMLAGFDLTEDGIARAFTAAHQHELRFDHTRGRWFRWTGTVWQEDRTKLAFSWCRRICRKLADEGDATDSEARTLAKAGTAAAVERFAQSDQETAVTGEIWDRDPWLLGTPNGTVELRTGELRAAKQDDFISRLAAVSPARVADCPRWMRFLHEATDGDAGLIRFLQQWAGYSLTGVTNEHALLFVYGPGGNGKSVWLNTLSGLLGEYVRNAAMDTFTKGQSDKHPTDLAMLRGARMVCASETEEGHVWAEVRIKQLTGGDTIAARFMRQDFFEFRPQFKLTIIGNHRPVLRNVDAAARRRFNIVPFVHRPAQPDKQLEDSLKLEWPGILRWMMDGCLDWQRNGLLRPASVIEATNAYFSEQDTLRQWIDEQCETGSRPPPQDTTASLFASWRNYALARGEEPGTAKRFVTALQRQGFEPLKRADGERNQRGFRGLRVRLSHLSPDD